MPVTNLLRETCPATPEAVRGLRHAVERYARAAGIEGELLAAVLTAFAEAVANVVRHAYPDQPGDVHVSAAVGASELRIKVADDGIGCNASSADPGLGLGLGLMADACSSFELQERRRGGTLVTMKFRLESA